MNLSRVTREVNHGPLAAKADAEFFFYQFKMLILLTEQLSGQSRISNIKMCAGAHTQIFAEILYFSRRET